VTDFKLVPTNILSNLQAVRLYNETLDHIQNHHPEVRFDLPNIGSAIENTIVRPTYVEESHGNSYVFVDETTTNWSGDPLRVPIKLIGEGSGRVRTAYFASTTGLKNVVWRRSDD
jgi:hypothetical protein